MSTHQPPSRTRVTIFAVLYVAGILAQIALIAVVCVWGITGTLGQNILAVPILIAQGVAIMGSAMWWLPVCAAVTGLPKPGIY